MTYIIAEIGQNHNGSTDIAIELVNAASAAGCDAVKMTMRDLNNEMTKEAGGAEYRNKHSYGATYLAHRLSLELRLEDYMQVIRQIRRKGMGVVLTFCSHTLLDNLYVKKFIMPEIDYIKVASRDITNTMLLERINKETQPVIISTGMCTDEELDAAVKILNKNPLMIMHCTSSYPTKPYEAGLDRILQLKDQFKNIIGYSDHTVGIEAALVAAAMGAKLIEKHITLNKSGKGSDHACSVEPSELGALVEGVSRVNELQAYKTLNGFSENKPTNYLERNRKKLMRSVCSRVDIRKGEKITMDKLTLMSPGDGIPPSQIDSLTWRLATIDIPAHTKIELEMIK